MDHIPSERVPVEVTAVSAPDDPLHWIRIADEAGHAFEIVTGPFEAMSARAAFLGESFSRPLTYDLMAGIVGAVGWRVAEVRIDAIRSATFIGTVVLQHNGDLRELDARTTDAINLALRLGAPIYLGREMLAPTSYVATGRLELQPGGDWLLYTSAQAGWHGVAAELVAGADLRDGDLVSLNIDPETNQATTVAEWFVQGVIEIDAEGRHFVRIAADRPTVSLTSLQLPGHDSETGSAAQGWATPNGRGGWAMNRLGAGDDEHAPSGETAAQARDLEALLYDQLRQARTAGGGTVCIESSTEQTTLRRLRDGQNEDVMVLSAVEGAMLRKQLRTLSRLEASGERESSGVLHEWLNRNETIDHVIRMTLLTEGWAAEITVQGD